MEDVEAWKLVPPGYSDLDALLQAEIGKSIRESIAAVKEWARLAESHPLPKHGGDRTQEGEQASPRSLKHGETAEYLARRIARDHPDILARMKSGEFKSVKEAARAAGIVKPTMTVPAEPAAAIRALITSVQVISESRLEFVEYVVARRGVDILTPVGWRRLTDLRP